MTERDEARAARRLERLVERLRRGESPAAGPQDASDQGAIRAASQLASAHEAYPRMDPEFRRRLAAQVAGQGPPAGRSRRWALAAAAGIVGGAALGVAGERLAAGSGQRTGTEEPWTGDEITPEAAGAAWIDTGVALADLEQGSPKAVTAGGLPLFLVRDGEQVRALSSMCTHKPCQLRWNGEAALTCPWGRAQSFALDGTSSTEHVRSLPWAQVRVVVGRVEILGIR